MNRPVFGSGDDAGWSRKLRQLRNGDLREIETYADVVAADGRTWAGRHGHLQIAAVIRDQFVAAASAPLPDSHPAYMQVRLSRNLARRMAGVDLAAVLAAHGATACELFDARLAFVEPGRPGRFFVEGPLPISDTIWSFEAG